MPRLLFMDAPRLRDCRPLSLVDGVSRLSVCQVSTSHRDCYIGSVDADNGRVEERTEGIGVELCDVDMESEPEHSVETEVFFGR